MRELLLKLRTFLIVLVIVATVLSAGFGMLSFCFYLDQYNDAFGFGLLSLIFISIFGYFIFKQDKFNNSPSNSKAALLKEKVFNSIRRGR